MGAYPPEVQMTDGQTVHGNVEDIVERRMFLETLTAASFGGKIAMSGDSRTPCCATAFVLTRLWLQSTPLFSSSAYKPELTAKDNKARLKQRMVSS